VSRADYGPEIARHPDVRAFAAALVGLGLAVTGGRRTKHWQLRVVAPNGATWTLTLSVSAGDHRTITNTLKDARRELRRRCPDGWRPL
jgi:hypothetical protein